MAADGKKEINDGRPIAVRRDIFAGIEAVRRSGESNMLDRPMVARLALEMGHVDAACWIEANGRLYAEGVFRGFIAEDE